MAMNRDFRLKEIRAFYGIKVNRPTLLPTIYENDIQFPLSDIERLEEREVEFLNQITKLEIDLQWQAQEKGARDI